MDLSFKFYTDEMEEEVIDLFVLQYGVDKKKFTNYFINFYSHPYQKEKALKVVALDMNKVVGFQSFFYWPYKEGNKSYNSFQSGNSIVHPDYRGHGIFQKLLNFIYKECESLNIDFLMGFPVEASKNSFIRNNWLNILDLCWFIKVINPLSLAFGINEKKLNTIFSLSKTINSFENSIIHLKNDNEFNNWRNNYSLTSKYYFFYENKNDFIEFELSFKKRNKYVNELIIGNVVSNSSNRNFYKKAIKLLTNKTRKLGFITLLTFCSNTKSNSKKSLLISSFFRKINKKIYFIIRPFKDEIHLSEASNWELFRHDIDTW